MSPAETVQLAGALAELGLKVWSSVQARRSEIDTGMTPAELISKVRALAARPVDELLAEGAAQVQHGLGG